MFDNETENSEEFSTSSADFTSSLFSLTSCHEMAFMSHHHNAYSFEYHMSSTNYDANAARNSCHLLYISTNSTPNANKKFQIFGGNF